MRTLRFFILLFIGCDVIGLWPEAAAQAQEKEHDKRGKNPLELKISYSKKVVHLDELFEFWLELKNVSDRPITIVFRGSFQLKDYLTYFWRDPGENWQERRANFNSSDLGLQRIPHILKPGMTVGFKEEYHQFSFWNCKKSGLYQKKVLFEYQDPDDPKAPILRAESNVAEITLLPFRVDRQSLECRLIIDKTKFARGQPARGRLELKNVSKDVVTFHYVKHPLEHVHLVLDFPIDSPRKNWGITGKIIRSAKEAPATKIAKIKPGEVISHEIDLFMHVPMDVPIYCGVYQIEAEFKYRRATNEYTEYILSTAASKTFEVTDPK